MSFARIIAGSTTETPRYVTNKIDDPDNISITRGLYQINSHVFMGIHDRPSQHKQVHNISKMIEWNYQKTPKGKASHNAPEPGKEIWNQRLAEYTIVTHDGGLALPIASAVHALRQVAPHYNSALQFPLPLHLAEDLHEYTGIIYDNNGKTPISR